MMRPDFLNLTICAIALLQLNSIQTVRKTTFRWLIVGIMVSFIYDIFWLSMEWEEFEDDLTETKEDGKIEQGVKQFSLYISVVSLFFRIIVISAFWRASIDFKAIMKQE